MIFYRNPAGKDVAHFSYSQGQTLVGCPRKYILERHYGWIEWPPAASREFGKAIEVGARACFQHGDAQAQNSLSLRASVLERFDVEWEKAKALTLEYKDAEKDWDNLSVVGRHLLTILAARRPRLGIQQPTFYDWKTKLSKSFVGDAKLDAIPDMIDWPEPHPVWGDGARIDDIKTAGKAYPEKPANIVSMDEQLRTYSWVTGIERVAFLVLVKGNPNPAIKKGGVYTLLNDAGEIAAGTEVLCRAGGAKSAEIVPADNPEAAPVTVSPEALTGCRMQFIEGRVDPLEAQATVEALGAEAELAAKRWELFSGESGYSEAQALAHCYPQRAGMRFPNDKCTWCPMIGLCLKNDAMVKDRIIKAEDAWLEELE